MKRFCCRIGKKDYFVGLAATLLALTGGGSQYASPPGWAGIGKVPTPSVPTVPRPDPDRKFGGKAGWTLRGSSRLVGDPGPDDATAAERAAGHHRRRRLRGPDTFGGPIRTPNLTRVAEMGLTYNRFHVTAVCSPTGRRS